MRLATFHLVEISDLISLNIIGCEDVPDIFRNKQLTFDGCTPFFRSHQFKYKSQNFHFSILVALGGYQPHSMASMRLSK